MSEVVTELNIDADVGAADQFAQAMDRAGASAGNAQASVAGVSLAIAGISAGMIAAITGVNQFLDYIARANKQLADMQTMAKQVGLSLADFQGLQFGGQVAGLSDAQINAGLEKSAQLLNDAQRNANSLSKEFEANGLSIKNANGQLISQNQLLGIAADLVKRARSPGDQLAIAQMLGFTKEWIPLLEQGAGAMAGLTGEAQRAGAVIDDETVKRAAEFDKEWRKSSVEFSAYMKSSLVGLLPYIDDIIERSKTFFKGIDTAAIEKAANEQLNVLSDAVGGPKNEDTVGIRLTVPETVIDNWKSLGDKVGGAYDKLRELATDPAVMKVFNAFLAVQPLGPNGAGPYIMDAVDKIKSSTSGYLPSVQPIDQADVKWYAGTGVSVTDTSAVQNTVAWTAAGAAWKKYSADVLSGADTMMSGFSKVVPRATDVGNAFTRAETSVKRSTDQLYAEADALGLGDGALAKFRTEAQLTSAAQAAGLPITDALKAKIAGLGDDAADAANDLAKFRVATQIDFTSKTAFLSPEDVQIAQQLKGIYGNDVPAALASTEAAAMRTNNAIKEGRDAGLDFAKSLAQGFLQGKNGTDALIGALDQLASKMADKALTDLFSGNFVQGGIEAVVAISASLISGKSKADEKAAKELKEAQDQWAKLADQVTKFNLAAKGIDLGPLTNELTSLQSSMANLVQAAYKAKDYASANQIQETYLRSIERIVGEFGAPDNLTGLQKAIKGVNDEATGLIATLQQFGNDYGGIYSAEITAAQKVKIAALVAQYTDTLTSGLQQRLNSAEGKSYLNDAAALIKQRQQDLADAAALGNDPAILSQISVVFQSEAQKIVQDAGLVGDQFAQFTRMFPELGAVVKQATVDVSDSIKTIRQYLEGLQVGANSILSPQDQLALAQTNFSQQLASAQGGDATALGSITSYAQTLLDQAKGYYASSSGYAAIYQAVTAALGSLAGVSTFTPTSATAASFAAVSSPIAGVLGTSSKSSVANDNGALFAQQTSTLVQAIGAANAAEVQALREGVDAMNARLDRIVAATEAGRGRAARPNGKSGAFGG